MKHRFIANVAFGHYVAKACRAIPDVSAEVLQGSFPYLILIQSNLIFQRK